MGSQWILAGSANSNLWSRCEPPFTESHGISWALLHRLFNDDGSGNSHQLGRLTQDSFGPFHLFVGYFSKLRSQCRIQWDLFPDFSQFPDCVMGSQADGRRGMLMSHHVNPRVDQADLRWREHGNIRLPQRDILLLYTFPRYSTSHPASAISALRRRYVQLRLS